MFEKYNLLRLKIPSSTNKSNFLNRAQPILNKIKEQPAGKDVEHFLVSDEYGSPVQGNFCIRGEIETLPFFLTNVQKEIDLIRMQSFVIAESYSDYYTERSNYHSYLLCYTYCGNGTLIYEGNTYVLHEGDGFLIDCRKAQKYFTSGESWKHLDLHFTGKFADHLYNEIQSEMPVCFSFISIDYFNKQIEKILDACTLVSAHKHIYIHQAIYNLLVEILQENERKVTPPVPKIYIQLIQYMETNYMTPITLDDMSKIVSLNKYYLIKEFKKYIGSTPNDYLISLRIQNACTLLHNTNMTIGQICEAAGFDSRTNFIRQFKKKTNTTPTAYRKYLLDKSVRTGHPHPQKHS